MPWSASTLFAPARPELKQAWLDHPALASGLHLFPRLPHCQFPAVGLLAVAEIHAQSGHTGRQDLVDRLLQAGADHASNNAYGDALTTLADQRQIQLAARQ